MPSRRARSANRKRRDRERFWRDNADRVRVVVIGVGAVVIVSLLAQVVLA